MLARLVVLCGLFLVVGLSPAFAQQEARSSTKGASTPLPITGTSVDADHNALDVYIRGGASGSGGGTEFNEDTSHSSGAAGTLMLGVRNDAGGTTFTDTNGDYSPIAVDNLGRVIISILSLSPGTSAANLGKAEDAGHSSGDVGVMSLCVRAASATDRSAGATDGDYEPCAVDANGKLWTNADTEMPAAATLADDTANPTVPGVASFNMCFDGTNWDRCTKATAGQGAVDTATQRVTLAQGSTACPNYVAISQTADTTLVSGTSSQYFYICSIILVAGAAEVVSLWEGTGTACGTGSTAILGSTTEANGLSISANGGFSAVSGTPFLRTATTANDICLRQSGANRVSGVLTYYKAP